MLRCMYVLIPGFIVLGAAIAAPVPKSADASGIEFFEKRVRPLLVENCLVCHGGTRQSSGLRVDRMSAMQKGGARGPAVIPGDVEKSLLVQAVRYTGELRMPPKGKLRDDQIADFIAWVKMGAPAPAENAPLPAGGAQPLKTFDLAERRKHWCYQPVRNVPLPSVKNKAWPISRMDYFILAKLEAGGLAPAPPCDRRTYLRRVTFDLTGLPPTPDEIAAFLADNSPRSYERVVDRLFDSPHYGERWARHWLDLVRFAETLGHEFDFELLNAYRYRDYVIRAFNADVPYNQFVIEHVAGDLLPIPRRHPTEGTNESILGTAFWWLGEAKHSPVDTRQEQAERIDNQLDVFGKTFVAQTIACARCHDHKFDAIKTKDYYALAGYLKSSRYQQVFLDPHNRRADALRRLHALKTQTLDESWPALADALAREAGRIKQYLLGAHALTGQADAAERTKIARGFNVDLPRAEQWARAVAAKEAANPQHPLYLWGQLASGLNEGEGPAPREFAARRQTVEARVRDQQARAREMAASAELFEDFARPSYETWFVTGEAFGTGPARGGEVILGDRQQQPLGRIVPGGWAHSGLLSRKLEGEMRSRTFTLDKKYMHFLVAGQRSRINVALDGFAMIRDPIYGRFTFAVNNESPHWRTVDVATWRGRRSYLELLDSSTPPLATPFPAEPDGYLAVKEIWFSDDPAPPSPPDPVNVAALQGGAVDSLESLADRYQGLALRALRRGASKSASDIAADASLLNWLLEHKLLESDSHVAVAEKLAKPLTELRRLEGEMPPLVRAPALADGTAEDEYVFMRGNYKVPGEPAPRRLPEVLGGLNMARPGDGSGRLELAQKLVSPSDPLVSRVMVNRIWKHHFGEGIVRSTDDFGRMGQPPTHPELLDFLATEFTRNVWSIKRMHREMVLSQTYRMTSQPSANALRDDPQNKLLSHMPIRRLEGEAIRDAMLVIGGSLNRQMFGVGALPYLTEFLDGRGRPAKSGPLDGDGRRSIYLQVRRNFLHPMFLAFDTPIPFTTIGRRSMSNVPAQALAMLNDPFVVQQARRWAERVLAIKEATPAPRVQLMYVMAFGRPPLPDEMRDALAFVDEQSKRYGCANDDARPWADLGHVLMNVKEFIFVN